MTPTIKTLGVTKILSKISANKAITPAELKRLTKAYGHIRNYSITGIESAIKTHETIGKAIDACWHSRVIYN